MKKAVILGNTGQDGHYLSGLLHERHYETIGISSKQVSVNPYGLTQVDITQQQHVDSLLSSFRPDEIYFLAAVHQSSSDQQIEDGTLFQKSLDLNVSALINFLEWIRKFSSGGKLFYAASSHVFGNPEKSPQDETTPFRPDCIYGITKTAGVNACRFYRENHGVFASVGIFYNHESPLRASKFVSKKIVEEAVAIKRGLQAELVLGNLESQIDWGYAPDYMRAVFSMMQLPGAGDFVISSGEIHTIREFVEGVFERLELDWKKYVKVNPALITKRQKRNLFGNNRKINQYTGWSPQMDFKGLIAILVDEELKKNVSR